MGSAGGQDLSALDLPVSQRPPASLQRRLAAKIIDALTVLSALWAAIVLHILWFFGELVDKHQPEPWGRRFVTTVAFVLAWAVYEWAFLVHSQGQTPGKDIMKLRVVSLGPAPDISTGRALFRWLPVGLLALLEPMWLIVVGAALIASPAVRSDRRVVHDVLARTRVVDYDRDREDPAARRPRPRWRRRQEARAAREESDMSGRRDW